MPTPLLLALALPLQASPEIAALSAAALPAPIVRRHDREDARYLALARRYPAVCSTSSGGSGVLVAPRWVLTASHVARPLHPFRAFVRFPDEEGRADRGRPRRVDRVVLHPGFRESPRGIENDVALLRLAEPIDAIEPVGLYRGRDELDRIVTLVGCGLTGDGNTGAVIDDGRWRGATNRVEEVREDTLHFRFHRGAEATDLEGFWGPGDSGNASFLEADGRPWVVAVSSYGGHEDDLPVGSYGGDDVSFRVSTYAPWLEARMSELARAPAEFGPVLPFDEQHLPGGEAGECLLAYFDALQLQDPDLQRFFVETFAAPDVTGDLWFAKRLGAFRAALTPTHLARHGNGWSVLARMDDEGDDGHVFHLEFEEPAGRLLRRVSHYRGRVPRDE